MSIHYKFRSAIDRKVLPLDSLSISADDFINQVCKIDGLRQELFSFILKNESTQKEYSGNDSIPRNTCIVIQRVPCANPIKIQKVQTSVNNGVVTQQSAVAIESSPKDLFNNKFDELDEVEKLQQIMKESTGKYDSSMFQKNTNMDAKPPPDYCCNRCYKPGHFVQHCPMKKYKSTNGIMMRDLVETTPDDPKALYHYTSGKFYARKNIPSENKKPTKQIDKSVNVEAGPPSSLICPICTYLIRDALIVNCCQNSFCAACIEETILKSENQCPGSGCNNKQLTIEDCKSNDTLRQLAQDWPNASKTQKSKIARQLKVMTSTSTSDKTKDTGINLLDIRKQSDQPSLTITNPVTLAKTTVSTGTPMAQTAQTAAAPPNINLELVQTSIKSQNIESSTNYGTQHVNIPPTFPTFIAPPTSNIGIFAQDARTASNVPWNILPVVAAPIPFDLPHKQSIPRHDIVPFDPTRPPPMLIGNAISTVDMNVHPSRYQAPASSYYSSCPPLHTRLSYNGEYQNHRQKYERSEELRRPRYDDHKRKRDASSDDSDYENYRRSRKRQHIERSNESRRYRKTSADNSPRRKYQSRRDTSKNDRHKRRIDSEDERRDRKEERKRSETSHRRDNSRYKSYEKRNRMESDDKTNKEKKNCEKYKNQSRGESSKHEETKKIITIDSGDEEPKIEKVVEKSKEEAPKVEMEEKVEVAKEYDPVFNPELDWEF